MARVIKVTKRTVPLDTSKSKEGLSDTDSDYATHADLLEQEHEDVLKAIEIYKRGKGYPNPPIPNIIEEEDK